MTRYKHLIVTFFLFLFIFTVYFGSSSVGSTDSMWSIHTSISLIKEGNLDINEYLPIIKARNNYAVEFINGKIYTFFPKGVSIISLPIVYLLSVFVEDRVLIANAEIVENICASFFTALTSILVFYFGRYYKLSTTKAVFLSLLFSFCTSSWSTTSRCLWMHGPSMFFLALALYIILQAKERNSYLIQFASIPLAFSYLIRPTNSISILVFSVYTFLYYRKFCNYSA